MVSKITDANGNTISSITPTVVKQTMSEGTCDILKEYMYHTVSTGTGKTAKVDGYSMGGKTGTAQMYDEETHRRKEDSDLVSFMGFVPYEDPQLVIYCVIDQPNSDDQAHSSYAQNVVREILEEVLPYLHIYPDEELTGINSEKTITGTEVIERNNPPEEGENTSVPDEPSEAGDIEPNTPEN